MDLDKFRVPERLAIKQRANGMTAEELRKYSLEEGFRTWAISVDGEPIKLPDNVDMNRLRVKVRDGRVFYSSWG